MLDTCSMNGQREKRERRRVQWWTVWAACFILGSSPLTSQTTPAAAPLANATATELLTAGFTAYGVGKFQESIDAYQKFISDFGNSAESAVALPQILPLLALSQIRLEKWADASETIESFLTKHSAKAAPAAVEDMKFWEAVCLLIPIIIIAFIDSVINVFLCLVHV